MPFSVPCGTPRCLAGGRTRPTLTFCSSSRHRSGLTPWSVRSTTETDRPWTIARNGTTKLSVNGECPSGILLWEGDLGAEGRDVPILGAKSIAGICLGTCVRSRTARVLQRDQTWFGDFVPTPGGVCAQTLGRAAPARFLKAGFAPGDPQAAGSKDVGGGGSAGRSEAGHWVQGFTGTFV